MFLVDGSNLVKLEKQMGQAVFHDEGRRIRSLAKNDAINFTYRRHALDEMRKDNITKPDVEFMLRSCRVNCVEQNRFEETWNVYGRDADGRAVQAVVVAYEEEVLIKIITAWC